MKFWGRIRDFVATKQLQVTLQMSSKVMNVTVPIPANQIGKVRINIQVVPVAANKVIVKNASLHLSGLSPHVKRTDVRDAIARILGSYGEITDIRIPIDLETGFLKGYAFAVFNEKSNATRVLNRRDELASVLNQYLGGNIYINPSKGF